MPKIKYEDYRPSKKTRPLIEQMDAIATDYYARGYDLTARQLYYQLVSRNLIENNEKKYDRTSFTRWSRRKKNSKRNSLPLLGTMPEH
jgi:hypothetical protein